MTKMLFLDEDSFCEGLLAPPAALLRSQELVLLLQTLHFLTKMLEMALLPFPIVFGVDFVSVLELDVVRVAVEMGLVMGLGSEQFFEEVVVGELGVYRQVVISKLGILLQPVQRVRMLLTKLVTH